MNIQYVIDTTIRNKFTKGFARHNEIKYFVIHGTGGGGTYKWIADCDKDNERGRRYKNGDGLFHFLIERDGKTIEIIDPDYFVYHSSIGARDCMTIGCELLNPSVQNSTDYTDEQYESLLWLYCKLKKEFDSLKTIISHNKIKEKYTGRNKACPGSGFNWKKFETMLKDKFNFDKDKETFFNIESP